MDQISWSGDKQGIFHNANPRETNLRHLGLTGCHAKSLRTPTSCQEGRETNVSQQGGRYRQEVVRMSPDPREYGWLGSPTHHPLPAQPPLPQFSWQGQLREYPMLPIKATINTRMITTSVHCNWGNQSNWTLFANNIDIAFFINHLQRRLAILQYFKFLLKRSFSFLR